MLTVAVPKRNKLPNIIVLTPKDGSIDGMQALKEQLQYYRAGETVKITVATPEKNGEYAKRDVEVTLGKKS